MIARKRLRACLIVLFGVQMACSVPVGAQVSGPPAPPAPPAQLPADASNSPPAAASAPASAPISGAAPAPRKAALQLAGARLWPAHDYTRLTLEARSPLHWTLFSVETPDRLVLDLDGVVPGPVTEGLPLRVNPDDPWVRAIRVGRFKPGVLRIVLDLKAPVKASAVLLDPVGDYRYRLVLDIYPAVAADPLLVLLQEKDRSREHADDRESVAGTSGALPTPAQLGGVSPEPTLSAGAELPSADTNTQTTTGHSAVAGLPARAQAPLTSPGQPGFQAEPMPPVAPRPTGPARPVTAPADVQSSVQGPPAAEENPERKLARRDAASKLPADRLITVAIDAGHGGEDPGAHGEGGTLEKDVTLAIAQRIKEYVDAEPNLRAVLVRDGDYFIPLQGRTSKARRFGADLFVSVHADAFINRDARGSSVFILSERGASSVAARWLANKENQADQIGGVNVSARDPFLAQTLFDLSQTATIQDSQRLGRSVLKELGNLNPLHRGEVEQAGFAVLKSPDIPSILVETAFITNPNEERRLGDGHYQDRVAATIARGIRRYLQAHPPIARSRSASVGSQP